MKWFHCDYVVGILLVILALIPGLAIGYRWIGLIAGLILIGHTAMGPACPVCKVMKSGG